MMNCLISVIIPAFNRAHLIGETLDSIIAQSYTSWECLVVDDGSTDATVNVIEKYTKHDNRIRLYKRPNTKPKGANACRNIGLETAQGAYVVFFDSDDLMTEHHLEVKVEAMQKHDCDYVITKTQYFNHSNAQINNYYQFDTYPITPYNYISQLVNWLTLDICIKVSIAKSICFNENLQSGQEYNYFSKLVHTSTNAAYINEVVSLRRHHGDSIRSKLNKSDGLKESFFRANWYTYIDLKLIAKKRVQVYLMRNCIRFCYDMKSIPISTKVLFIKQVFNVYGLKGFYFICMHLSLKFFNKGYFLRQKLLED